MLTIVHIWLAKWPGKKYVHSKDIMFWKVWFFSWRSNKVCLVSKARGKCWKKSIETKNLRIWNFTLANSFQRSLIAVVTLQGFVLGKLDLLTVSLGKLKFGSVTDFSLSKLPRESFIIWGLKTAREQKNLLWISLDNYPKAEKGKNEIPE